MERRLILYIGRLDRYKNVDRVLEAMRLAGITDTVVVSPHKHGLSDYLGSGRRFGLNLTYVVQDDRKGLADDILIGEHAIDGSFVVVLGDNFFRSKEFLRKLITYHFSEQADATIGVAEVEDVTLHGIILPDGNRIADIIEKPSPEVAISSLGAKGAYVFEKSIFDAIRETKPWYQGELQLTDSVKVAIDQGRRALCRKIDGIHIDVGTPADLIMAKKWYMNKGVSMMPGVICSGGLKI